MLGLRVDGSDVEGFCRGSHESCGADAFSTDDTELEAAKDEDEGNW